MSALGRCAGAVRAMPPAQTTSIAASSTTTSRPRLALFGMDPETGARRILLDPRDGGVREGQGG